MTGEPIGAWGIHTNPNPLEHYSPDGFSSFVNVWELDNRDIGGEERRETDRDWNLLDMSSCYRVNSPSVTMPKVPSAPMNNLVVSQPAEDLRAL